MSDFLSQWYVWIKAFHIIGIIAWMAGLFYLPRLFVYHSQSKVGSAQSNTFIVMERNLLRIIINPAMIMTYLLGGCLLFVPGLIDWSAKWLHVKVTMVLLLTIYHGMLARYFKAFSRGERPMSERFFRIFNEIPTFILVIIVVMVVVKPF